MTAEQLEFELFRKRMQVQTENNQAEFGIPDRIITEADVRLWRFSATVIAPDPNTVFFNPTPVYSGTRLVGSANVLPAPQGTFEGSFVLDYNIPERLDFDNERKPPNFEVTKIQGRIALTFVD
jgi:hypothetical protein